MRLFSISTILFLIGSWAFATAELKVDDSAPLFKASTQTGAEFSLSSRRGQWTILYFYPKAGSPGCTKQACAFRDSIDVIRAEGAEVYGISADTVKDQAKFHKEHHLNFDLLADPKDKVIDLYGTKMNNRTVSKRWTFVIDPELKIKAIMKDVDPVLDSEKMAAQIKRLKGK